VFKDKNKIYIQNRRGATRVETPVSFQNSQNPLVLNNNGVPKILASSDKGKVFQLFFDGKYKEKEVGTMSSDHFFTGADINASGQADYVFMDGRNLEVYDEDGNKLFAEKMDNRIQTPPVIYRLNGAKAIGITDRDEKKVYLFDEQGAVYPGFPLAGTGEFIIENINNKMCLVTPLNKSVVCYLLE
jgi:hypothetical protein